MITEYLQVKQYFEDWVTSDTGVGAFLWGEAKRRIDAAPTNLTLTLWVEETIPVFQVLNGDLRQGHTLQISIFEPNVATDDATQQDNALQTSLQAARRLIQALNRDSMNGTLEIADRQIRLIEDLRDSAENAWGYNFSLTLTEKIARCP